MRWSLFWLLRECFLLLPVLLPFIFFWPLPLHSCFVLLLFLVLPLLPLLLLFLLLFAFHEFLATNFKCSSSFFFSLPCSRFALHC